MTATAQAAAEEFYDFYDLKTVIIPPNRPCVRTDLPDLVFAQEQFKTVSHHENFVSPEAYISFSCSIVFIRVKTDL